jgi:hypothetical protein
MSHSSDKHYEVIHYFLADTEMNLMRLWCYLQKWECMELLETNEKQLLKSLNEAFKEYNDAEVPTKSVN